MFGQKGTDKMVRLSKPVRKVACMKKSWHKNEISMHEYDVCMHGNCISRLENKSSAPKIIMDENVMHEIVHIPMFHNNF